MAHRIEHCPECGVRLGGVSLGKRRQVSEVPPPPPVEVIEHQVSHGWWSGCQNWREAPLDLRGHGGGQGRLGVRRASLIAPLRTVLRVPVRPIQVFLPRRQGLRSRVGEISDLLARVAQQMHPNVEASKAEIRASSAVQA